MKEDESGVFPLERRRMERINSNNQILANLGLPQVIYIIYIYIYILHRKYVFSLEGPRYTIEYGDSFDAYTACKVY